MRSLILITNDDSVSAKGLQVLVDAVREYGDIVVMSTELNASGKSHALTTNQPLRVRKVRDEKGLEVCPLRRGFHTDGFLDRSSAQT